MPSTNRATHEARCATGRTKLSSVVCDFCGQPVTSPEEHQDQCEALKAIFARQPTQSVCEMCGATMAPGQLEDHKVSHMLQHRVSGEFIDIDSFKATSMKARGLSLEQIKNELPVFLCTPECQTEDCPICMGGFTQGESLRLLPCIHKFHVSCIDTWLESSVTCPICKVDI